MWMGRCGRLLAKGLPKQVADVFRIRRRQWGRPRASWRRCTCCTISAGCLLIRAMPRLDMTGRLRLTAAEIPRLHR